MASTARVPADRHSAVFRGMTHYDGILYYARDLASSPGERSTQSSEIASPWAKNLWRSGQLCLKSTRAICANRCRNFRSSIHCMFLNYKPSWTRHLSSPKLVQNPFPKLTCTYAIYTCIPSLNARSTPGVSLV